MRIIGSTVRASVRTTCAYVPARGCVLAKASEAVQLAPTVAIISSTLQPDARKRLRD